MEAVMLLKSQRVTKGTRIFQRWMGNNQTCDFRTNICLKNSCRPLLFRLLPNQKKVLCYCCFRFNVCSLELDSFLIKFYTMDRAERAHHILTALSISEPVHRKQATSDRNKRRNLMNAHLFIFKCRKSFHRVPLKKTILSSPHIHVWPVWIAGLKQLQAQDVYYW